METFDEMLKAYTKIRHEITEDLKNPVYEQKECWYRCGNTAIHAAAHSGHLELVKFLISHGGNMANAHGQSAKDILSWKWRGCM
jgi:hypothetical protein